MTADHPETAERERAARQKNPLRTLSIRGVLFGARRSDDGLWCRNLQTDQTPLPWLAWLPWRYGEGGGSVKIGAWIVGVMW